MIRVATISDMPRLLELGRAMLAESTATPFRYDMGKTADSLARIINGGGVIFVSERDGVIVGGFAGGISEQWYSMDKVAFDYALFIEPGLRSGLTAIKLVKAFETWATEMGALEIRMGITTGVNVESTSRLYEYLGFQNIGPMFAKRVG